MELTERDAQALLDEAGEIRFAVQARSPREHLPFFAWGLVVALSGPIRDLGDDSILGSILMWIAPAVGVALIVKYLRQSRQVRVKARTPNWLALALLAWVVAATILLPDLMSGVTTFAYSLAVAVAATPILVWAERLRRTA